MHLKSDRRYCGKNKLFNMQSLFVVCCLVVLAMIGEINGVAVLKRDALPELNVDSVENSGDKSNVNYDEYPVGCLS